MAGHPPLGFHFLELWLNLSAHVHHPRTARAKVAARRGIDGTGHVSFEDDPLAIYA